MSLLLSNSKVDAIVPILIIFLIFGAAALIVFVLKRKFGKERKMITKHQPKSVNVEIRKPYMKPNEIVFLKNLDKVLPAEFVAYPKVIIFLAPCSSIHESTLALDDWFLPATYIKSIFKFDLIISLIYGSDNIPPFPPPPKNKQIGRVPEKPYFLIAR